MDGFLAVITFKIKIYYYLFIMICFKIDRLIVPQLPPEVISHHEPLSNVNNPIGLNSLNI